MIAWLLITFTTVTHAGVLFIDLNNAPKEYGACMDGAGADNVHVVSQATNEGNALVSAAHVERKIQELAALGQRIDAVVISGHQGAGHAFGDGGELHASQLQAILNRNRGARQTVRSMGLINCYGGNVAAAEEQWLLPNPNIRQTFGFPGQSPTKNDADTATLVKDYCQNHAKYAEASSKDELCRMLPNITQLTKQSVSLCSREAVAAPAYGKDVCYDYHELHARCAEFDPGENNLVSYMNYLAAEDPCGPFKNPPRDKNSAYRGGSSPLRGYYNQLHLWRHCHDQIAADRGYELPATTRVIRLIKYDTIKANLARLNKAELADYDRRLTSLCLGELALGDITRLSRAEMNHRITAALRALESRQPRRMVTREPSAAKLGGEACQPPPPAPTQTCSKDKADPAVVAKMAFMLKETFVDLNSRSYAFGGSRSCTHFHLVEENAPERFKSRCLLSYEAAAAL